MKHAATDTAAAIKAAAKELFAKHGYSATTTRQIARAVSLQAAAIYYHFRSKNEILLSNSTGSSSVYTITFLAPCRRNHTADEPTSPPMSSTTLPLTSMLVYDWLYSSQ